MLRFAINSTKALNIKDLRNAILAYIISQQQQKSLFIEIHENEKEILPLLHLFSIEYSKIITPKENRKYHTTMAMKLLLDKKAFNCFCSLEALEQDKLKAQKENKPYSYSGFCETISDETKFHCNAPFVVRIKKPLSPIVFSDTLQGKLIYTQEQVDSFEILNFEKSPTENFILAINDMLYDVSSVLTDTKELDNTPKQIHIRESLGYTKEIQYIHIPITLEDEEALPSVQSLIDKGYLPAAIANYLVTIDYDTPKEIFTLEEAIEWFEITQLSSKSSFDFEIEKLNHINTQYIDAMDNMRLSKLLGYADEDIGKLAKLFLKKHPTLNQLQKKVDGVFAPKESLKSFEEEFTQLKECLKQSPYIDDVENLKQYLSKNSSLQGEQLNTLLSYAITGEIEGPELNEIYPLIKNYLKEIIK